MDVSIKGVSGSPMVEEHIQTYAQPQFELVKVSTSLKGLIKLSPPSKKVTLDLVSKILVFHKKVQ